jgi:5-methylcytosine-specific restriction endonuclease McrA
MRDYWVPETIESFSKYLQELRSKREKRKKLRKASLGNRRRLKSKERDEILSKTGKRCHICGGIIENKWEADHVLSYSGGGENIVENFLPAHSMCNNYRWNYISAEFHEILRMGVWLRTQIERKTTIGKKAGNEFIKHEKQRIARRKKKG